MRAGPAEEADTMQTAPGARPLATTVTVALLAVYAAGVLVVALTAGKYVWFGSALFLVPLVAAGLLPAAWTLGLGTLCTAALVGLYGLAEPSQDRFGDWLAICSVAVVSLVCAELARVRARRGQLLARARVSIAVLQRALLPQLPITVPEARVDGFYAAAEAEALVGGDLYEVVDSPYGTRLLIGDVQGKGLEAVGTGASVLAAFREAGYYQHSLEEVADRLEHAVLRHHQRATESDGEGRFVTALLLEIDGEDRVRLLDCGHVPPLLIGGQGTGPPAELPLDEPGLPLGLGALADAPRRTVEARRHGARMLLCTDGVTEARDTEGTFYPLTRRLAQWADESPEQLLRALYADLDRHLGGSPADDATALLVTFTPDRAGVAGALPDGVAPARRSG